MVSLAVFGTFVVCLLLSLPIGIALIFACAAALGTAPNITADSAFIFRSIVTGMDSFTFLAIPLFVLSGNLMAGGGISDKLFRFFSYFVGNKTAGMPIAVVISCLFYGAITGSGPATVAAIGTMAIPVLVKLGYKMSFATALVAVAGGLGVIIPPSIPFVVYGQTAGVSVASLFTGGILPGCLIGLCLMVVSWVYCKKNGEDKKKLQENYDELHQKSGWQIFKESFWALLTPVIILGGIYSGLVTPTEAACVSVFYALIVGFFIYKTLKLKDLLPIFFDSVKGMIPMLFVCCAAIAFGRIISMLQLPQMLSDAVLGALHNKIFILLLINAILLFLGMIIDGSSAIMITTPLFMPIIQAIGMNPVHFGVMMVCNLAIGFVTPPVGINLFVASSLTQIPVMEIAKHAAKFIFGFLVALLLITFVPAITMLLV